MSKGISYTLASIMSLQIRTHTYPIPIRVLRVHVNLYPCISEASVNILLACFLSLICTLDSIEEAKSVTHNPINN